MTMNDTLAAVLSHIVNCEKKGVSEAVIGPVSKLTLSVLSVLKEKGYVGDFKAISEARGGRISVQLLGRINKCGVVKPRFSIRKDNCEKFEKRFLLAKGFGVLVVTTSKGVMTYSEANEKNLGGKLLAYCY